MGMAIIERMESISKMSSVSDRDIIDEVKANNGSGCLLYTSPSPRDRQKSRMPSSA